MPIEEENIAFRNSKLEKDSEIVTFAAMPYEEHFPNSFSLKSRHGKKYLVMNMKLDTYNKIIEEMNITRVSVLSLKSGECYIIDSRIPRESFS